MIDGSYVKAHQHGTGVTEGNQAVGRAIRGLTTKLYLAEDAHGMPVRMLATAGTAADCTRAAAWNCSGYTAEAEPEGGVGV